MSDDVRIEKISCKELQDCLDIGDPMILIDTFNKLPDKRLAAEAHFDIDRTRWNIIYGSNRFFSHLGMHLVYDLISIQMKVITI